jgi:phage shock protein E
MKSISNVVMLAVAIAALVVVGLRAQDGAGVKHTEDSIETVKANLASGTAVILDVREQAEWEAGHLNVAQLVPLSGLKELAPGTQEIEGVAKDKVVYLHCRSGKRVLSAAPILSALGYEVRPLPWGYDALVEKGLERAED